MENIVKAITEFFKVAEALKIRSEIIPIQNKPVFEFDAAVIKPYSFTIVNTGTADMISNGIVLVKGANANMLDTSLDFPRVGTFKRNDIIKLKSSSAIAGMEGFIRVDLELTG